MRPVISFRIERPLSGRSGHTKLPTRTGFVENEPITDIKVCGLSDVAAD
jgi:hypothetical protein